jgi:NAD(P)-dependent dehydrogenase (short-subunit alcohol dehydrogenase family)
MRLACKVAIITGAASGMGAATARRFAREGAKVVLADVLEDEGQQVAEAIRAAGNEAKFLHLDVADEANWQSVIEATVAHYGKLDTAVNNAGISGSKVNDTLETEAWHRLIAVNATGVFLGMKFEIPEMRKAGRGSIINISSISGNIGQANIHIGYNASKGAVRTMTKTAAVQFGPEGIRVNSIHPGLMPPMRSSGATADPALRQRWLQRVPLGRFGEVDDVANVALFLASDESSYMTGSKLHVDGGYLAG